MTETWVHGNVFVPRLYGPDHLLNVGGIGWTDQQGLKDGHVARFIMRDERTNWFHVMLPSVGQQQLTEVRAEFSSTFPSLVSAWVHSGNVPLANTNSPAVASVGTMSTFTMSGINRPIQRGICLSLGFSTMGIGLGQGEISFYAAGAIFS